MSAYTPPDKIEKSSALALVQALIGAQRAINSMKVEAETAAQGDEQMMLDACEQISNEGLEASLAIQAALSTAAQPPADSALNTIAAMFHSGEEIDGPDGLAIMVDMALWNEALEAFDEISGDEMEPAQPPAGWRRVPVERVPLTEAQLKQIHHIEEFGLFCDYSEFEQIARAIEQVHGIKPKEQP